VSPPATTTTTTIATTTTVATTITVAITTTTSNTATVALGSDTTKLAGESTVSVPDVDAVINSQSYKTALNKAYATSFGTTVDKFTKFEITKARRLAMLDELDTGNSARRMAAGNLKVEYVLDLAGLPVASAAQVVAKSKSVSSQEVATNVKKEMTDAGYPNANNIVVKTVSAAHPTTTTTLTAAVITTKAIVVASPVAASSSDDGVSPGVVVAIVCAILFVAILAGIGLFIWGRKQGVLQEQLLQKERQTTQAQAEPASEPIQNNPAVVGNAEPEPAIDQV
jgi:hypothetical protein